MSVFSQDIKFKFPWRKYQQRVLETLDTHLQDDHLHVIAPPGSGKTVLGLEVMLRIGHPTLILAPTIAIRNQWIQRFCELFLQQADVPDWISKDIRSPRLITVVTYQGLHSACHDHAAGAIDHEEDTDLKLSRKSNFLHLKSIVQQLKKLRVQTLILDESHHLKKEWWQTLSRLKKELKPKTVGLTATPPYDVSPVEWHRYIELNGPIDVEISVPELMEEGDLCPHQDFVFFTRVGDEEYQKIVEYRRKASRLYEELKASPILIDAIQQYPMLQNPLGQEYTIFEHLDFYAACLIFLQANAIPISAVHLEILGIPKGKKIYSLPPLDEGWLTLILRYLLFDEGGYFIQMQREERDKLYNRLKAAGVVDRKTVKFTQNATIDKRLSSNISKLTAIEEIVALEYAKLKHQLRQVILADYVRKEYLLQDSISNITLKDLGVVPIFEHLRRRKDLPVKLAVLTGTLVIIPIAAHEVLCQVLTDQGSEKIAFEPLAHDSQYLSCVVSDQNRDQMVYQITQLLQQGHLETLIGTKALLGEGWDAPAINSLVLATVVGSFVSSNQMRGRAIRTDSRVPDKTSTIWHLACVDPTVTSGGVDVELITRRFRNFVGISETKETCIQNGFARLAIYDGNIRVDDIAHYNSLAMHRASNRGNLKERWQQALPLGSVLVEEIKIPSLLPADLQRVQAVQLKKTVSNMMSALGTSALFYAELSAKVFNTFGRFLGVNAHTALLSLLGVGSVFFAGKTFRTFRYYLRYRDVSKDIYHIGNTLVQTLCKYKIFSTPIAELNVLTYADAEGYVYCHLEKGTTYEKSIFVQMIQEIVDPISNPRYIIVRKNKFLNLFEQADYHAVPSLIAKKGAMAKAFLHFWKLNVGDATLVFTKSMTGCTFLIQSKIRALSNQTADRREVEHTNTWR